MDKIARLLQLEENELAPYIQWYISFRLVTAFGLGLLWIILYNIYYKDLVGFWPVFVLAILAVVINLPLYLWLKSKRALSLLAIGQLWFDGLILIGVANTISDTNSIINMIIIFPVISASLLSLRTCILTACFISFAYIVRLWLELRGLVPAERGVPFSLDLAQMVPVIFLIIMLFLIILELYYYTHNIRRKAEELIDTKLEIAQLRQQLGHDIGDINQELFQKSKESERKFKLIFENANDAMIFIDPKMTMTDVNQKLLDITGLRREEIINKNLLSLLPSMKVDINKALPLIKDVFSGRPYQASRWKIINKRGEEIAFLANGSVIREHGRIKGLMTILSDISPLEETEKKLKKQISELAQANKYMIGRELDMIRLKKEINKLSRELGRPDQYKV